MSESVYIILLSAVIAKELGRRGGGGGLGSATAFSRGRLILIAVCL